MKIRIEQSPCDTDWLAKLDTCVVRFRNERQALVFAEQLQVRLDAPHNLPEIYSETSKNYAPGNPGLELR
ncbi:MULTISPECIES: hypothetical protein [unclassified Pseudomonas]|uniref:hypothetical protein n=1 Tax=unclassified Pseudomonas TaxID=196821 RepID=UPI002E819204|nr:MULTISPECIES: hypothetical protein [unclassified Pseudomonas]